MLTEKERERCYWVKGTNQRLVQRHMHGAQTPVGNDVVKSPVTALKRKSLSPPTVARSQDMTQGQFLSEV